MKRRKTTSTSSLSARVRKLESKVETKMFDVTVSTQAAITTSGTIVSLGDIAGGALQNQRIGNMISPFFLKVRLHWNGDAAGTIDVYRTLLVQDKRQKVAANPVVLDVLHGAHPLAQYNNTTRNRFKILFDRTWTGVNDAAIFPNYVAVVNIKLNGKMGFTSASSTSKNMNGIYLINISNVTANAPDVLFSSRLFYKDG